MDLVDDQCPLNLYLKYITQVRYILFDLQLKLKSMLQKCVKLEANLTLYSRLLVIMLGGVRQGGYKRTNYMMTGHTAPAS